MKQQNEPRNQSQSEGWGEGRMGTEGCTEKQKGCQWKQRKECMKTGTL